MSIGINLDKAKAIAHNLRRQQRAAEFAPLDMAIAIRVSGLDPDVIEKEREVVREKYALIQEVIETAETPEEVKAAIIQ